MRVLVTRPEPGAGETAARLEALGYEPIVLPLTEIRPLAVEQFPDMTVDAVAITSVNAVRHAPAALIAGLSRKACLAVGDRSAEAAREAGFSGVTSAEGDAAALARMIAGTFKAGVRIAYLCGRVRRPEFEAVLARHAIDAVAIETYDTVRRAWPSEAVRTVLGSDQVEAALVYSVMGAEALAALALQPEVARLLAQTRYCCLSPRIAEALGPAAAACVVVSPEPTDAALISLLGASGPQNPFPVARL